MVTDEWVTCMPIQDPVNFVPPTLNERGEGAKFTDVFVI